MQPRDCMTAPSRTGPPCLRARRVLTCGQGEAPAEPTRSALAVTARAALDTALLQGQHATAVGAVGVVAAVDREASVSVHGFSGQGDVWSASWRWWEHRPRVAIGVAAPRLGGLPGVWHVHASWEEETFRIGSGESDALVRQSHTRGGLIVSDWLTPNLRYSVGAGLDAWDSQRKAASLSATLERRLLGDRVAMTADVASWRPFGGSAAFHAVGARLVAHSSTSVPSRRAEGDGDRNTDGGRSWSYAAAMGVERVSDSAPLGLWPGAGDGRARTPLLRAHPLLADGIIDATGRSAFGRTLSYASAEVQRWLDRPALVRIGVAAFADAAGARRGGSEEPGAANVDVGGGLRFKLPLRDRVLRIDFAHGLRDGAKAVTIAWLY